MRSFAPPRSGAAAPSSADRSRRAATARPLARGPAGAARPDSASARADRLPEGLQAVIGAMSGFSLADVVVHRNSAEPARLGALAYARGSDIHLGPGQERHFAHEAWHVVQQAQGRVAPTLQRKSGVAVNDDAGLEREADAMGARALGLRPDPDEDERDLRPLPAKADVAQRLVGFEFETNWDLKAQDDSWETDTVLVTGKNWSISPDEIDGDEAKMEFKTDPFDVDGADIAALAKPIEESFEHLKAYTDELSALEQNKYVALKGSNHIQVRPVGPLAAKPQATGGVREDLVLEFLKDMASDQGKVDLMPGAERKAMLGESLSYMEGKGDELSAARQKFAGLVGLLSFYVRRFQYDKQVYDAAIKTAREEAEAAFQEYQAVPRTEQEIAEKKTALRESVKTRATELRSQLTPTYAKARASALPRVAFNDLPAVQVKALLKHVLLAAGLTEQDGDRRMFPLGLKSAEDDDADETIAEWIATIQQDRGVDEGELWSSKALQAGPVGSGEQRGAGIPFELRALQGPLPADQWLEFAKPFLRYFRTLNRKAKPTKA